MRKRDTGRQTAQVLASKAERISKAAMAQVESEPSRCSQKPNAFARFD